MERICKGCSCKTGGVTGGKGNLKQHKKLFLTLGVVVVVAAILIMVYLVPYLRRHYRTVSVNISDASAMETIDIGEKKVLTVYFTRVTV